MAKTKTLLQDAADMLAQSESQDVYDRDEDEDAYSDTPQSLAQGKS